MVIFVEKVFEMVIIEGVRIFRMEDEIGFLEIGKKVDLVIFNLMFFLKLIFFYNFVLILVYLVSMYNVESVLVDGNVIFENGKVIIIESEE